MHIECLSFRYSNSGSPALKGIGDLMVKEWKAKLSGVMFFKKDGRQWIQFPSRKNENGEWKPMFEFENASDKKCFSHSSWAALEDFMNENSMEVI